MYFLKFALRNLKKQKLYSIINILGLAVGMATAISIYVWVNNEVSYDKFHKNHDRLFRAAFYVKDEIKFANAFHGNYLPGPLADFLRQEYPEIKSSTVVGRTGAKLTFNDNNFTGVGYFAHSDFLKMFTFPVIKGDTSSIFTDPLSIIISESMAHKLFADQDPVGQMIKINDQHPFTIAAVAEDAPANSTLQFDFLLSYQIAPQFMRMWDNKAVEVYVELYDQGNWEETSEKITNVYNDFNPNNFPNYLYLQPLAKMHLYKLGSEGGRITFIYLFSVLALFVLLIACINFINLSTARSNLRAKEIGIKKIVGSNRFHLLKQFLGESLLSSVIAFAIAIFLSEMHIPVINQLLGEELLLVFTTQTCIIFIVFILGIGLLSGLYPAFILSAFRPIDTMSGRVFLHGQKNMSWLRRLFVTIQFTLSTVFIIGLLIIFSQLHYCKNKYLGYDKNSVVVLPLHGEAWQKQAQIKQILLQQTNIQNATVTSGSLVRWNSSASIDWPGKRKEQIFDVGRNDVDFDFLKTFNMEMADGRFFSTDFPSDIQNACVLNETAIKVMEIENPVGKEICWCKGTDFERKATIIGIIKNYHTESFHEQIRPFILFPTERGALLNIKVSPQDLNITLEQMKKTIKSIAPTFTFSPHFIDDEISELYQAEILTSVILTMVALIAIFITILGLLGLVSFITERRFKEIGIRKVLGATQKQILVLLSKEFTWLVILANIIAWPLAWIAGNQWLQNFAFRISLSWWIFFSAGMIILGLTLLTISAHTTRAARLNPAKSLRYE